MLKGLKMENADVLNTLIELNTEISAEKISAICKNMPTSEEVCITQPCLSVVLMIAPASNVGRLFWRPLCPRCS